MPPKKKLEPTNEENIFSLYREILKTVDLKDLKMADQLQGDDLKAFCKFCHEVFNDPLFTMIVKGFIYAQCMLTAEQGITADHYWNGKLTVNGIKTIEQYFAKYASQYDQMTAKEEEFDPNRPFSPAKI